MTASTATIADFLLARIGEDEEWARPRTVIRSGGDPAPTVVNCIGPSGDGCAVRWRLGRDVTDQPAAIRQHEWTHATSTQARVLAECAAKRAIVEAWREADKMYGGDAGAYMDGVLRALASVYDDHPDYDPAWS